MSAPQPITDHQGMEVLRPSECWELVDSAPVGRIGFDSEGGPMVLPVNHRVVDHHVVFRTARGALLHEALMTRQVAFECDGWDAASRTGWSVVIRGQARVATEDDVADVHLDAWADSTQRDDWIRIQPDEVTGRRIVR